MKIIKNILLILLALVLIACTGIFLFFQTFDTDQYLPQITKKASLALGRPVSIGHVGLGLSSRGITLDAWPLIIGDDPGFTTQPFIKVDRIRVSLDLKSLLLEREIHVTGILLQSPQIHFIRSQEGNINARSLDKPFFSVKRSNGEDIASYLSSGVIASEAKQSFNPKEIAASPSAPRNDTIKTVFSATNIKSIKIQDASISFIDQSQAMPLDIWLKNINASLNDFELSKPFQLSFDAAPLVSKSVSPGKPDSPVFKNIAGVVQFNMPHLEGDIIITDGLIKDFNIIKTVLSHALGNFGSINDSIDNLLNGPLKSTLGSEDTVIEKAEAKFSYRDKTIFIDDSLVQTNILELTAKGSVDQGLNTDMQTMLHLNADASAALISELGGLKYLMDDSKRIAIGASLKGVIPHLKYKPDKDFRKKSRKALISEGASILGVLLGGR